MVCLFVYPFEIRTQKHRYGDSPFNVRFACNKKKIVFCQGIDSEEKPIAKCMEFRTFLNDKKHTETNDIDCIVNKTPIESLESLKSYSTNRIEWI